MNLLLYFSCVVTRYKESKIDFFNNPLLLAFLRFFLFEASISFNYKGISD